MSVFNHKAKAAYRAAAPTLRVGLAEHISTYRKLMEFLEQQPGEDVLLILIGAELLDQDRTTVLLKLHQRLCRLRRDREREDLIG